ncbi:MAG: sulfotransferase domain-containing protein [Methylomicrobium sp.]
MPAEMHRIARFLDIPIDESRWDAIVEYCSFDQMKKNATQSVTLGGAFWDGGAEVFIHKGVNERWKEVLSAAESAEYEAPTIQELGQEYAHWLATGQVYESMPIWFTVKLYGQLKKVGKNSKPFLHS